MYLNLHTPGASSRLGAQDTPGGYEHGVGASAVGDPEREAEVALETPAMTSAADGTGVSPADDENGAQIAALPRPSRGVKAILVASFWLLYFCFFVDVFVTPMGKSN